MGAKSIFHVTAAAATVALLLGGTSGTAEAERPSFAGPPDNPGKGLAKGKGLKGLIDLGQPHFSPARTLAHEDIPEGGIGRNFELVDHNPLIETGEPSPAAGAGTRSTSSATAPTRPPRATTRGIMILDISDPRNMRVVREMEPLAPPPSGNELSTDHVATIESENLLVQFAENGSPPFDGNRVELFDTTDCRNPVKVGEIPLPDTPHDLNTVWQGGNPHTVLLFTTHNDRRDNANNGFPPPGADMDFHVWDITDKANPVGPIASWSLQKVYGIPVREPGDLLTNGGFPQSNTIHDVNVSNDKLSPEGFPTRIYAAANDYGWFLLDSTPLADMLAGGLSCDVASTGPNPCLKKLHPDPNLGRVEHDPPFGHSNAHTMSKIPNRPYAVLSDEPGPCPWGWLRFAYIGGEEDGVVASGNVLRGDLYPSIIGTFRIPENREWECEANSAKFAHDASGDESFNPHLHLIFENIMFTSWNNAGIRAIDISDPGMPFETGFYFPPPVGVAAAGDVHPNLSLNSPPTLKDGFIYVMDRVNGVYVFEYTGPRSDELPKEGLFTGEQTQVPDRQP